MTKKKEADRKVEPKKTRSAPKAKTDYAALSRASLSKQVAFDVLAKGTHSRLVGVLVAYVPSGKKLSESADKVADPKLLDGFAEGEKVRTRADACVVRTNDSETGRVRFFTPRPQQVVWT